MIHHSYKPLWSCDIHQIGKHVEAILKIIALSAFEAEILEVSEILELTKILKGAKIGRLVH